MTDPLVHPARLWAMARKETLQLRRDPRSLILSFFLPVFLLALFGYAITWDVRDIALAIVDQDHSRLSRELVESLRASGYFKVVRRLEDASGVGNLFERGTAQIALVIPPRFESDVTRGATAPLQVLVDGSDANTATIALAYTRATVQSWTAAELGPAARVRVPVVAESRVWYNEELVSRNMIVPGLVAAIMAIIAAILTSLTIAREWERGTMEQLAATPVSRLEIVLGKLLPYVAIGMVDVVVTSLFGVLLFGVPFRGSALLLGVMSFLFLVGALGLGMFISALARSQLLAIQLAMLSAFLPTFLLSGFMFTIEVMPPPLQAISFLVPARYFLVVTRRIFLKGVGLDVLYAQGLLMLAFAGAGLALAVRSFRKELG